MNRTDVVAVLVVLAGTTVGFAAANTMWDAYDAHRQFQCRQMLRIARSSSDTLKIVTSDRRCAEALTP